ncbi:hypothetical protein [Pseudarthrobacter sp. N5]|uniref:hypothetical protein n=1 Tax=Pseudarthrobacter sp. N5 TaxID=3418416 RepID=UPI003CECA327
MASVVAVSVAALHSAGPAGVAGDDDGGGGDVEGDAAEVLGLAEADPGAVLPCVCGWLGPQAVSSSATAAAAVVITSPGVVR